MKWKSLLRYVSAPWSTVLAAGPGRYVPNDHVGYTALAKGCLLIGNGGRLDPVGRAAVLTRLPSLLAGVLLPLAVAWPPRRTAPLLALTLAMVTAVHPVARRPEHRGPRVRAHDAARRAGDEPPAARRPAVADRLRPADRRRPVRRPPWPACSWSATASSSSRDANRSAVGCAAS